MVLNKRILRELRADWRKYCSLIIMIVVSIALIVSLANKSSVVNSKLDVLAKKTNREDGEFILYAPLSLEQFSEIQKLGVQLQKQFFIDYSYSSEAKLRMYTIRDDINKITLDTGALPKEDNELVLEKRFAKAHDFHVGDKIKIDRFEFKISGIGSTLDYNMLSENFNDVLADEKRFSNIFVTDNKFEQLSKDNEMITYEYAYVLKDGYTDDQLKKYLMNLPLDIKQVKNSYFLQVMNELAESNVTNDTGKIMLSYFIKAEDNQRITSCRDDSSIYQKAALIAGVFVFMIIAYMISTFISNRIEHENMIIGSLYSLGYTENEVLRYYMKLPVIITIIASILGVICALLLTPLQVQQTHDYYSLPKCEMVYPLYLFVYGIVGPVMITILVNYYVLREKLKKEPLRLLKNEAKPRRSRKFVKLKLKKINFITIFIIRQFINSIRENIVLFIGLFLAILILMFGIGIYACVDAYNNGITEDVNYQYQYVLNYPMTNEVYEKEYGDTEIGYTEILSIDFELTNKDMDVCLQGINEDNHYFPYNFSTKDNEVSISDAVAYKFNLKVGDEIVLHNRILDKDYKFIVHDIVEFSSGLYIYMDIDNMRDTFNKSKDYFNTIFSDEKLDIDERRVASIITRDQLEEAAKQMYDFMEELYMMMIGASIIIFIIVMYQLLKMIVDKSEKSISMLKIFGYEDREIDRIYLGGSLFTIVVSMLVCIKITGYIVQKIYPYMVSNRAAALPVVYTPFLILLVILLVIITYIVVIVLLKRHLNRITFSEILRSKE